MVVGCYGVINLNFLLTMKLLDWMKVILNRLRLSLYKDRQKDEKIILAKDFLFKELYNRGLQPEREAENILFHYRGGYFRVKWLDKRIIRIVYPFLYTSDYDAVSKLHRIVNSINLHYMLCKLVVLANSDDATISVHAVADLYYTSQNNNTFILENVLTQFFEMHHELLFNLKEAINSRVFDCVDDIGHYFSLN